MPIPRPPLHGHIIRYDYLWLDDYKAGALNGSKTRPCVIIAIDKSISQLVYVLPVTHTQPSVDRSYVNVPSQYAHKVGLDAHQNYIATDEVNVFVWPGPDVHPVQNDDGILGRLSAGMLKMVRDSYIEAITAKTIRIVQRAD